MAQVSVTEAQHIAGGEIDRDIAPLQPFQAELPLPEAYDHAARGLAARRARDLPAPEPETQALPAVVRVPLDFFKQVHKGGAVGGRGLRAGAA